MSTAQQPATRVCRAQWISDGWLRGLTQTCSEPT
ncbi:hypothetical protein vBSenM1_55 [Salmonella phage vB_SenM-1]|uniref:Uncharacterized protein n=2 Tax=Rosemountvirus TaxID=2733127 RepID=A0A6M4BC59_9CAUD|nr:hypothetical protein vBSenM1_55 [Salmonella phage vB_SenM-1]